MSSTKTAVLPITPDEAFVLITEPDRLRRLAGHLGRGRPARWREGCSFTVRGATRHDDHCVIIDGSMPALPSLAR